MFTYANDTLGRLSGVYQGAGLATPLASFAYTAQGLPQSRTEGTGSSLGYSYDAVGRLTGIADTFNWSPANGTLTFARNPAGQIVSRSQSNDGYAWAGAYTVNRPYTTNGLNQYGTAGTATFSYDANGNLTSDGSANFTYDVENRLVAAGGSRTAALRYDPLGRLYEVVGAATTRFLHDGDALVAEYNLGGTLTARYVHGANAGADDPLVWCGNNTIYWLHSDHQGSITAIANIDGNLLWLNAYDEYGIPRAGNSGRFQYTGQAWIGELGMYYYKARIYSPTLGRFLQTDPIGYQDQFNLYAYVGNDPVNATDPTGRQTVQDMQLELQMDDMRRQGMSEREILSQIGNQAAIEANALVTFATGVAGGLTVNGLRQAFQAAGWSGVRNLLGMRLSLSMSERQLGAKFGSHYAEWGLRQGREGLGRFRDIITRIGTRPERVVNGTFSGGGEAGRRAVQFRILGSDVVVTSRTGEFVTVLKNGINNGNVQRALRSVCVNSRIPRMSC